MSLIFVLSQCRCCSAGEVSGEFGGEVSGEVGGEVVVNSLFFFVFAFNSFDILFSQFTD